MFLTYLGRELRLRRKQTIVVVAGMALAIALVIIVNSLAAGVRAAQAQALESVYGVGTDITVSQTPVPGSGGGPGRFEFDAGAGQATADGTQQVSRSRLSTTPGTATFDATVQDTISQVDHVAAASAVLALENMTFSGEMPDFSKVPQGGRAVPGGADGAGGSAFDIDRFSVLGVDPAAGVGPAASLSVTDGRALAGDDAAANVAMVDSAYASAEGIAVGSTITVGDAEIEVVGIVESATGDGVATGNDLYLPLTTAQALAGLTGQVSDIYVQADSSESIDAIEAVITTAVPDATVSTQADLAGSVTGSLATASNLIERAGVWLSIGALTVAFLLAILFTVSGVNRRTRELGTLKAIGWRNRRVVGQVVGESMATGLIAGLVGLAVGVAGVVLVNQVGITLTGAAAPAAAPMLPPGMPEPVGGIPGAAATAAEIIVTAPLNAAVACLAVVLAVLGGLLAGMFGGGRAARLSPAEALRAVV